MSTVEGFTRCPGCRVWLPTDDEFDPFDCDVCGSTIDPTL